MRITIGGKPGSGKSSVAKVLAKRLGLKRFSMGDFMGEIAVEKNISLLELSKLAEEDPAIDREIDERQSSLGEKDDFVIDSRLGFHFIPDTIRIFLDTDPKVGAQRIFKDERPDESENTNLEETEKNISARIESEKLRYEKYYGVDPYVPEHYDLLIDTSELTVEQTADMIIDYLQKEGFVDPAPKSL